MNVKDKVCVVTGGASGIGLGLCNRFAREGAHVVLSDLKQDATEAHAEPIGAYPVACDVGREEDVQHLVEATVEHFGGSIFSSRTPASGSTAAWTRPPTRGGRSSTST
jgi:NAD(P)-dependent dehydrogenase (short-subunit alcohol dehydrogenase family)